MNWGRGLAAVAVVLLLFGGWLYSQHYTEGPIFMMAGVVAAILSVAGFVAQGQKRK